MLLINVSEGFCDVFIGRAEDVLCDSIRLDMMKSIAGSFSI